MDQQERLIAELSELAGILPEYYDIFGTRHVTSKESRRAILSAMGFPVGSAGEVRKELGSIRAREWLVLLDPVTIISVQAQPHGLAVHLPLPGGAEQGLEIAIVIEDEEGRKEELRFAGAALQVREERMIEGQRFVRLLLSLPQKHLGYYRLAAVCSHPEPVFGGTRRSLEGSGSLIVTPDRCYMPEQLKTGKTWGIAVNLYAIRSGRNWGVGDLGDLKRLVTWASGLGAGLVGINPLHAIPNTVPLGISPYSPSSRICRNFIYIDMESVEELSGTAQTGPVAERIESLRKSEEVDYEGVAELKRRLLEEAFGRFYRDQYLAGSDRGRAFREYLRREGSALEEFAVFTALAEERGMGPRWQEWPEEYHSPASPAVISFRKEHEREVLFFAWLQWLMDRQMAEAAATASAEAMTVGLYGDLAIGAVDSGSDGWTYQEVLAEEVTVGAPPDDFNHAGQDWGFPPMIPDRLRESGYELFIRTIRKNMEHMGALRIDHALGLFRLFWIPRGRGPGEGAYVRCNAEELLRIIALESVRNRTLVIGEDLGAVTDEARTLLDRFGILSYRLFYFERNYPDPSFLPPERYPAMALAAVTTHDLPTLSGYWTGRDLEVKKELGMIRDDEALARQQNDRERDRRLVLQALERQGMLPDSRPADLSAVPAMTPGLCRAVYRYLAVSPARIALVSLDDVIGTPDQQNLPGTVAGYPNWRQKVPASLEEIAADPRWQDLAGMFRLARPAAGEGAAAKVS